MLGSEDNLETYSNKYGNKAIQEESHSNLRLNESTVFTIPAPVGYTSTLQSISPENCGNIVQLNQISESHDITPEPKNNVDSTDQHFMYRYTGGKYVISGKSATTHCSSDTIISSSSYPVAFTSYQPYNSHAQQNLSPSEPIHPFPYFHTSENTTQGHESDRSPNTIPSENVAFQNNRCEQEAENDYSSPHNAEIENLNESNQDPHFSCDRFINNSCCGDSSCVFPDCDVINLTKSCPIRFSWNSPSVLRCSTCWPRRRLPNESMLILSVIQLLCGFAAIILSSVGFTKAIFLHQIATGLWAGVIMLITGFHGLIAARRPIMCTLVGLLALCLIVSLAACVLICVSVAGTIEDGFLDKVTMRQTSSREPVRLLSAIRKNFSVITSDYNFLEHTRTVAMPMPRKMSPNYLKFGEGYSKSPVLSDAHLRTYQIVLHLLLLLVGILEASVSLATSIICCRCVCSRPVNFALRNSRSLRTNIVSFNVATANQAASVLRSGAATNFVGTGNVLLAVSTESRKDGNALFNFLDPSQQIPKPYIHHTLVPFLNEFNERSLILTHAGTGSLAWAAARAAANLVTGRSHDSSEQPILSADVCNSAEPEPVDNHQPAVRRCRTGRRRRILCPNHLNRPRLLYTSFHTPVDQAISDSSQANSSFPEPPPFSPRSTLVYVMPSPTRDDPPMIFPPFPPSYNDLQKRPLLGSSVDHTHQQITGDIERRRIDCRNHRTSPRPHLQTVPRNQTIRRRLSHVLSRTRRRTGRRRNLLSNCSSRISRSTTSAPIPAGDRFIQPVLIIEDPTLLTPTDLPDDPPPKYSRYAK